MTGSWWRNALLGLILAGAAASPALAGPFTGASLIKATDGYVYFNRPGADMATHDSELRNCLETWQGGNQPVKATHGVVGGQGIAGDLIGAGVANIMMAGWEKARFHVNVEHCMVVRGWRVVVPDAEGKALAALDRKVLAQTLAPWVGAETPHGQIVRVWKNEAALSDTLMQADPKGSSNKLLSSMAMSPDAVEPAQQVAIRPDSWLAPRNGLPPLTSGGLTSVPEGKAVVIVRMTADSLATGPFLGFELDSDIPWAGAYRSTISIGLIKAPKVNGLFERTSAFVVTAGKWRLYAKTTLFDLCMGAPAFEVKAGEVVYLGEFNIGPQPLKPDLSLAPAQAYLGADSPLAAKLRPAEWVNGSTSLCRNWHPYALEFEGFPYEPGYVWGGAPRQPG